MKSGKYKLLVVDVDGTLITPDGNIPEENRQAVALARDAGIQVSLSTGRSVQSSRRIIEELGLDNHHIFFDGALVSRVGAAEPVYVRTLDSTIVEELVAYGRDNGIPLEFATVERYFTDHDTRSGRIERGYFNIEMVIGDLDGLWEREQIVRVDLIVRDPNDEPAAVALMEYLETGFTIHRHIPRAFPMCISSISSPREYPRGTP